jgi:hypothetical protein
VVANTTFELVNFCGRKCQSCDSVDTSVCYACFGRQYVSEVYYYPKGATCVS